MVRNIELRVLTTNSLIGEINKKTKKTRVRLEGHKNLLVRAETNYDEMAQLKKKENL